MKIRHLSINAFLIATLLFIFSGCVSEPDLSNYPVVSFKNEVQPIITGNCTQAGCHGDVNTEKFSLRSYDNVKSKVTAGNGRNSSLYRVITGRTLNNFMPPSPSDPLTEEQIRSIFVWIEQGAVNN